MRWNSQSNMALQANMAWTTSKPGRAWNLGTDGGCYNHVFPFPPGQPCLRAWNSSWLNGTTLGNQALNLILYEHFVFVRITSFNGAIKLFVFMNVCIYVITKWKKLITNLSLHNSGIHFSMPIFATETFSSFSYGTTARSLYFNYFL